MAAIKKWAKINGDRLVNINDTHKGLHNIEFRCPCCDKKVIRCMGDHNDWYFRHDADSKCSGGSGETIAHKLAKQIIVQCHSIHIPAELVAVDCLKEAVAVHGAYNLWYYKAYVEESFGDFRPDVMIDEGKKIFIEIYCTNKVTEAKLNKIESSVSGDYQVLEIRLSKSACNRIDDIDADKFKQEIMGVADEYKYVESRRIISSRTAMKVRRMDKESLFHIQGDYVICPAHSDYTQVVSVKDCKKCGFYIRKGLCSGKGCVRRINDFLNGSTREDRYDTYSELIPKSVGEVDYLTKRRIGTCIECGGELSLCTGSGGQVIKGLSRCSINDTYAHYRCKECGKLTGLNCPLCGDRVRVVQNRTTGTIFLSCENYKKDSYDVAHEHCPLTLTLWTSEPVGQNYADELLAVGSVQKFLSKKKCKELEELRRCIKGIK